MLLFGRTQMLSQYSYEEAVAFLMRSGFDGAEIGALDKSFMPRTEFYADGFAEKMRETLKRSEVRGFSVSMHKDYTESPKAFALAFDAVGIAAKLGAQVLIINGAKRDDSREYDRQWEEMRLALGRLAAEAENVGIKLAVELEPGFVVDNTDRLLRMLTEVGSSAVGANCDIGHVFLQDADPMEAIERTAPYIFHCHVENMPTGVHDHLVPWEGDMDMARYMHKLRDIGFDGGMSLDLYKYDYQEVCAPCAQYLRRFM
ncbi:MAG: sugar phosphate isomerase/epimerase [Ruminococcaceae bacterium]|nr:sugar phosphate isomerase/epimerase [Oscillospiraceae bacterium]